MESVDTGTVPIPKVGLGTLQNSGQQCVNTVATALNVGYRHIDTAQLYDNESAVGAGIATADVDRDDVFLTTKVWRSNLTPDTLRPSVEDSIAALDVEYIDLLLVHWPHPRVPFEDTLDAMQSLQDDGVVDHIGVSNFTHTQLRDAQTASDAPIVTDQVLYNPYKDQSTLLAHCQEHDIALTAYSPLARGAVLEDPVLATIGDRYEKTPAQVALRWLVQQDNVVAIPKASSRDHLEANLAVFEFDLTDDEMTRIRDLTPNLRSRMHNLLPSIVRHIPI